MKSYDKILSKLDILVALVSKIQFSQTELAVGQKTLEENQQRLEVNQQRLEVNQQRLEVNQQRLEVNQQKLETNQRNLEEEQKQMELRLLARIDDSQRDTIDALSAVIHHGYNMHEKRIKALEKHTKLVS